MKTIVCRKCGNTIDASSGECPVCGTMYYVIPEVKDESDDSTQVWYAPLAGKPEPKPRQIPRPKQPVIEDADSTVQSFFESKTGGRSGDTDEIPQAPPRAQGGKPPRPASRAAQSYAANSGAPKQGYIPPTGTEQRPRYQPPQRPANAPVEDRGPVRRPGDPRRSQMQREQIDAREAYREQGYEGRSGKKSPGKAYFIVAAVALLAVLVVMIAVMSGAFDFAKNEAEPMPDVIGMQQSSARTILEFMGLEVTVVEKESDKSAGTVIDQSIKKDTKLGKNPKVTLTVSTGPAQPVQSEEPGTKEVSVPNYLGMSLVDARSDAARRELGIVVTAEEYSDRPAGEILSQTPTSEETIAERGSISVVVSKGEEPVPTYTISVTAGKGGTVSPKGQVSVKEGESITFTVIPEEGYELRELKIDGLDVGDEDSYTFNNVHEDHTVYAVFRAGPKETPDVDDFESPPVATPPVTYHPGDFVRPTDPPEDGAITLP